MSSIDRSNPDRQFQEDSASQALGSGPLDHTTAFNVDLKLSYITFRRTITSTTNEIIKVTIDSALGSNYDTIILEENIATLDEFIYQPELDVYLDTLDEIRIQMTNNYATGTAYIVVHGFRGA